MEPSPSVPQDFKNVVSDPSATLCGNFIATLLKLPLLLYRLVNWMLTADGVPSCAFIGYIRKPGMLVPSAVLLPADNTLLLCDGAEYAKSNYPDLYTLIGNSFGVSPYSAPSNANNFRVPDYRARSPFMVGTFPSGAGVAIGAQIGEEKHVLIDGEDVPHFHYIANGDENSGDFQDLTSSNYIQRKSNNGDNRGYQLSGSDTLATIGRTSIAGGNDADPPTADPHNNIPPGFGCYIYICAGCFVA